MARLGRKIIDNLQLKIVNVHIRFEEHSASCTYGWGLTLKEISFTTTDRDWQATFVDRNEHARPEKLFKMMKVEQLNIYWQSGEGNSNILISMLAGD